MYKMKCTNENVQNPATVDSALSE